MTVRRIEQVTLLAIVTVTGRGVEDDPVREVTTIVDAGTLEPLFSSEARAGRPVLDIEKRILSMVGRP